MGKLDYFIFNNQRYERGSVLVRRHGSAEIRDIFIAFSPTHKWYLVIRNDLPNTHSNPPRSIMTETQFLADVIRIDSPTPTESYKVKDLLKKLKYDE